MAPKPASSPQPPSSNKVLAILLVFSLLMVTVPIGLYFASDYGLLDGIYSLTVGVPAPDRRPVASAILAVLGVNLVVGGFIWTAFKEVNAEPVKAGKKD